MKWKILLVLVFLSPGMIVFAQVSPGAKIVSYTVDPKAQDIQFYWKDDSGQIRFATQSGPMLLINGAFHPAFKKGSSNVNIRNGVGVLPDNRLLFAMSEDPINFYDLADYFKQQGCQNALYLDGFVSRTYLPEKKWEQTDGDFGVIIGVAYDTSK